MTRLPKRDEPWTCGDATTTVLAVHGNEVARTSTDRPDRILLDDLDFFLRHFTPPVVPVPEWAPKVLYIDGRGWTDGDYAHDDPGCLDSPCLRYVLDTERPWEVEPS